MGVSGGVTASTSRRGEEEGVKGRGDSTAKADIRTFEKKAKEGNNLRGE